MCQSESQKLMQKIANIMCINLRYTLHGSVHELNGTHLTSRWLCWCTLHQKKLNLLQQVLEASTNLWDTPYIKNDCVDVLYINLLQQVQFGWCYWTPFRTLFSETLTLQFSPRDHRGRIFFHGIPPQKILTHKWNFSLLGWKSFPASRDKYRSESY